MFPDRLTAALADCPDRSLLRSLPQPVQRNQGTRHTSASILETIKTSKTRLRGRKEDTGEEKGVDGAGDLGRVCGSRTPFHTGGFARLRARTHLEPAWPASGPDNAKRNAIWMMRWRQNDTAHRTVAYTGVSTCVGTQCSDGRPSHHHLRHCRHATAKSMSNPHK